jgi:hypothetical protein
MIVDRILTPSMTAIVACGSWVMFQSKATGNSMSGKPVSYSGNTDSAKKKKKILSWRVSS